MTMTRRAIDRRFVASIFASALLYAAATCCAPSASADTCTFELSPPQMATLTGGVVQVTASLTPRSCTGTAIPQRSTVCLAFGDSSGRCETAYAWTSARVFLDQTQRDGTRGYQSSGKGCVDSDDPARMTCRDYGPTQTS